MEKSDKSVSQIAAELDLTESTVRNWVKAAGKVEKTEEVAEQREFTSKR